MAVLARAQHGVLTLPQLVELGLTPRAVQKRALADRLHRLYRSVYALVPGELLTRDGRFMAAVLACGDGAVISHRTAAALHELRATDRANIDVTVPSRSRRDLPGIDIHRSTTLDPSRDTTRVNNIPCTTVARTQLDLADVISRRGLERVFDQAAILEVFDLSALEDQLARNRTRSATTCVRAVLAAHRIGHTATWTRSRSCS